MLTVEQVKKATLQEQVLKIRALKVFSMLVFCAKEAGSTGYNSWEK
jgi:hypothetical protein